MIKVFTKINNKLAEFRIDTQDHKEAIETVKEELVKPETVLAFIKGGKDD